MSMLSALLVGLSLTPATLAQGAVLPEWPAWEDPAIFQSGKLPAHATLMAFPGDPETSRLSSDYALSLNGSWKVHWVPSPEQRPLDFFALGFDESDWATIEVPSNVELGGYGTPIFTYASVPFLVAPPRVTASPPGDHTTFVQRNPVSSYRRHFTLPPEWSGRRTLVAFEGVASAFYLWCNGVRVGYSEDEHTTAEFDLTEFLVPGDNLLAVEAYRYSDADYLGAAGSWNLSGIYRDVYLRSVGSVDLADLEARAELGPGSETAPWSGHLDVLASFRNHAPDAAQLELQLRLLKPGGQLLASARLGCTVPGGGEQVVPAARWITDLETVWPWCAESPALYTLELDVNELLATGSQPVSRYAFELGFRRTELRSGELWFNGAPLEVRGVHWNEHDPVTGRTLSEERLREDLVLMKRHHINTLRTSGGPSSPRLLELCDELGLFVWNEARHLGSLPAVRDAQLELQPSWQAVELDRFQNLAERDKNHPSVLIWSGGSSPAVASWQLARKLPGWIASDSPGSLRSSLPGADRAAPGPSAEALVSWSAAQAAQPEEARGVLIPSFPQRAVGNGLGGLREHWEQIRELPHVQGLFLDSWVDQGLWTSAAPRPRLVGDRTGKHQVHLDGRVEPGLGLVAGAARLDSRPDLLGRDGLTLATVLLPNPEAGSGAGQPIITKGDDAWGLAISRDGAHLEFFVVGDERQSLAVPFPADWSTRAQHVIVTYDGRQLLLFINGRELGRRECSGPPRETAADLTIGLPSDAGAAPAFGSIRVLALWERALDLDEVLGPGLPEAGLAVSLDLTQLEPGATGPPGPRLGLGGDFGDVPNDGVLAAAGLVSPDRHPSPALAEVQAAFQDLTFSIVEPSPGSSIEGQGILIRVLGAAPFGDLNDYELVWSFADDGLQLAAGRQPMDDGTMHGALKHMATLLIPFLPTAATQERLLTLSAQLVEPTPWAPAGFEIAWQQLALGGRFEYVPRTTDEPVTSTSAGGLTILESGPVRAAFDDTTGSLVSLTRDEVEYLAAPLAPNFWRPPLGLELEAEGASPFLRWKHAGQDALVEERNLLTIGPNLQLGYDLNLGRFGEEDRGSVQLVWSMSPGGALELNFNLHPATLPDGSPGELLRVGMSARLPARLAHQTWYGRGPHESYPDRKRGARLGIYEGSVQDLLFPYLRAQESGNHSDVRWTSFTAPDGHGIRFTAPEVTPAFGALEAGAHPAWTSDVAEHDAFLVWIAAAQAGLASADPRGALDRFRLGGNREYSYRFWIEVL